MRALLDANALYPTVMREVLLGVARAGLYTPLWSARILEEWARAAAKLGTAGETVARGEIALLQSTWPNALVPAAPRLEAELWLPDADDVHVLATAIAGGAEVLVTMNAKDFPRRVLEEHGIDRWDPDAFLLAQLTAAPEAVRAIAGAVLEQAEALSGTPLKRRWLFKKARLPRFAKALD